jgi:hypothetical protein
MSTLRWLTVTIVYFAIILPPIARILQRAGFSRWWCLFWAVPLMNIIAVWVLAFVSWPAIDMKRQ